MIEQECKSEAKHTFENQFSQIHVRKWKINAEV